MSVEAGFNPLRIAQVRRETSDAVSILLEAPADLADLYRFDAGQHLTVRAWIDGEEKRRNYSVCVAPEDGELRIAIKAVAGGAFSNWANAALKAGDTLDVMRPHGSFTWRFQPDHAGRYVGFAGGSGITPVLSLLKTALAREPRSTFTLLYGNRSAASVIFLEELAGLKNRYVDRLQIYHILEDDIDEIELFNGRLDQAKCDLLLDRMIDVPRTDAFFICGPGPMMDAAERALETRHVGRDRIRIERFTTDRPSAADDARDQALRQRAAGLKLQVSLDQRRTLITFDPEAGNILDSARQAGLTAPYACKGGVCATCRAKVLAGTVEMKTNYGLSAEEVAQGYILTCQAVPTSEGVVVSYDE